MAHRISKLSHVAATALRWVINKHEILLVWWLVKCIASIIYDQGKKVYSSEDTQLWKVGYLPVNNPYMVV